MGSANFPSLVNKAADSAWGLVNMKYPGLLVEVGNSQEWTGRPGVRNKAIAYEDDSGGSVIGTLYLGLKGESIGMIGSKAVFPDCSVARYLDGTKSEYAVEVIPLTSLEDYPQCLLLLKLTCFGAGQKLLPSLKPEELDMGFHFTFKEILEMMKMVENNTTSKPGEEFTFEEHERHWDLPQAIQKSIFKPPTSLPYPTPQSDKDDGFKDDEDDGLDEFSPGEDTSSNWSEGRDA